MSTQHFLNPENLNLLWNIIIDENISNSNREFLHLVNRYIGNSSEFDTDIQKNSFNQLIEQYFEKLKLIYIICVYV